MQYIIIVVLSFFCATPTLWGQSKDTLTIEHSRVVGQSRDLSVQQVLAGEEMERLNTQSVADALRYFSGVQLKDFGGIGGLKTANVRSLGAAHVGVFYDGIELGNAQNGVIDLGRFSLDNMEAVSLYNGQKDAIFMSAKDFATSSSIYLQSREPVFDEKSANFNVGLKAGSFKTVNPSFLWEQKINDNISSSVSTEYLYSSGEYKFTYKKKDAYDTTAVRENGDIKYLRAEAGLYGKIKDGGWKTKVYYYGSERGYPGAFVRTEPGRFKNADRQWDNNFFVQGSLRKRINVWYSIKVNAKYANDYLRYVSDPSLDASTMPVDNTYKQQEAYASLVNYFELYRWWSFSLSSDVQYNVLDADLYNFVYPRRLSSMNSLATLFNFKKVKIQASILHSYINDTKKTGSGADLNAYSPAIMVSYKPFKKENLSLRAFYKSSFRMPTLNDLYYTIIGNTKLEPETTNQYNLGLIYNKTHPVAWLECLGFRVDAYFNEVENKIVALPTSNQFRWMMLNFGYVQVRGLDAQLKGDFRMDRVDLSARVNYTYQKAQDFTDKGSEFYGGQVPYIPKHSGSAVVGLAYRGWGLNYSFIYTGQRWDSVANIPQNYIQPWYTHDLSLVKGVEIFDFEWKFTLQVNNIFNQQYEVIRCYPMPGTNFNVKLNVIL